MSDTNIEKKYIDTSSPYNRLREELAVEKAKDYIPPKRILSIDFVKGFAIVFIILAHTTGFWFDSDWIFLHGIGFALLDILGPSLFVFLSALSVIFSVRKKQGKLAEKVIRNGIFFRGITIMIIGIPYNLIAIQMTIEGYPFPLNLWGWNILMFIGVSQIASYYFLKLKKMVRAVIGAFLIFTSDYLRLFLYLNKGSNIFVWLLHYIITSPAPQVTLLPWLSICFISTIFGEYLFEAMEDGSEEAYIRLFRKFTLWGAIFVIIGITLGLTLYTTESLPGGVSEYPLIELLEIANTQKFIDFVIIGMPEFLIRGRMPNMWYNLGAGLLLIALFFYIIDIKKVSNLFTNMFQYYGKVSLSLFLIHYMLISLFLWQFNIVVFVFVYFGYAGFLGFLMYLWMEFGNGILSPEWIMAQIGGIGQKSGEKTSKGTKIATEKAENGIVDSRKKSSTTES
jgi:uncharacterized membrane protein